MTTDPTAQKALEREQFLANLHQAAELRREIERYESGRDSYIKKITQRYERWLKPLRDKYDGAIEPVLDDIREHHKEIFAETPTVDELDAVLKRIPSERLLFDPADEQNIITHLLQAGHDDLVKVVKSLKKDPIKQRPEVVEATVGLRIGHFINVQVTFKPRPASDAKPRKKPPTETIQIALD